MSCCSIRWCGKNSKTSNYKTDGITFHRFPQDPDLKKRWMDCAKRESWFPSNYSVICSRHFTEDCFYTVKSRRRLFDNAIPTLNLPVVCNIPAPDNANPIPSSSSQKDSLSTTPKANKLKATDPETLQFNSVTIKRLCRRIIQLTSLVKRKNKTIKVLRDKVRYYKKKASNKVIITDLEKKNPIEIEDAEIKE